MSADDMADEGRAGQDTAAEDAAMLASLAAVTPEARDRLFSALAEFDRAFPSGRVEIEWGGGQLMGSGPDAPLQAPYPIYPPAVEELRSALSQAHAVYPFDWMAWEGWRNYPDGPSLATAPVADAVRMVTRTIRGERFYSGAIGNAINHGALLAATRRIADALRQTGDPRR